MFQLLNLYIVCSAGLEFATMLNQMQTITGDWVGILGDMLCEFLRDSRSSYWVRGQSCGWPEFVKCHSGDPNSFSNKRTQNPFPPFPKTELVNMRMVHGLHLVQLYPSLEPQQNMPSDAVVRSNIQTFRCGDWFLTEPRTRKISHSASSSSWRKSCHMEIGIQMSTQFNL